MGTSDREIIFLTDAERLRHPLFMQLKTAFFATFFGGWISQLAAAWSSSKLAMAGHFKGVSNDFCLFVRRQRLGFFVQFHAAQGEFELRVSTDLSIPPNTCRAMGTNTGRQVTPVPGNSTAQRRV